MPQPKYNKEYISRELFDFYRMTKQPYEGFVIGLGYAFIQKGAMMTSFSTNYNPSNPFCQGTCFFDICTAQALDTSPEAVVRSLNLKAKDFETHLVQKNHDGTFTINMGHGKVLSLPQQGTTIDIDITERGSDAMFKLLVSNVSTREFHSVECKLREYQIVFNQQYHSKTISLPSATNDYMGLPQRMEELKTKDSDISTLIGIGAFLASEGNRFLEGRKFRYKNSSIFERKPTHWYTKNNTWRDVNKWYNQYTGNRDIALKKAIRFQKVGRAFFIGGVFLSSLDLVGGAIDGNLNKSLKGGKE